MSGRTVSFDATASIAPGSGIASYRWRFGDRGSGSGATVAHRYAGGEARFVVDLVVAAGDGETATVRRTILVRDGAGDVLVAEGVGVADVTVP